MCVCVGVMLIFFPVCARAYGGTGRWHVVFTTSILARVRRIQAVWQSGRGSVVDRACTVRDGEKRNNHGEKRHVVVDDVCAFAWF